MMGRKHDINEKAFRSKTVHTLDTLHIHMKKLDSRIFKFDTSMILLKYHVTSHMSKLERDIAIQQEHLKTHERNATTGHLNST